MKRNILSLIACWSAAALAFLPVSCDQNNAADSGSAVEIGLEEVADDHVSFTISAPGAALLTYRLLSEYDAVPSASDLLSSGIQADPVVHEVYTLTNLFPETVYRIAAAAMYGDGSASAVEEVSFKTRASDAVVPTLVLRDVKAASNSISLTLVPDKAAEVAYICVPASDGVPSAEKIFSEGYEASATRTDMYVIAGLFPETEYIVAAVARSEDGICCEVQSTAAATLEPEPVAIGDFYYSDGSWSSGSEAPLADKECIGVIVLAGRSSISTGEDTGVYYTKDGHSRIDNITAYVVALKDAAGGQEFAWGSHDVDGDSGAETSHSDVDFMGYYNTCQIKAKAESKAGGLSDDPVNNYPATYAAAVLYEEEVPAPATSSGWFLPSAQQIHYTYLQNEIVNKALEAASESAQPVFRRDATYWSSSEYWAQNGCRYWAYMVNLDSANSTPGYISSQQKTKSYKVRSWLVF